MSSGKLVDTTFSSGADEELAVVDVYDQSSSEVVNSWQDFDSGALEAADKAVEASVSEIAEDLTDTIKDLSNDPLGEFIEGIEKGKGLLNVDTILDQFGTFGGIGPFKSLSTDILGNIKNIAGGDVSAVMCRVEDFASKKMDFASMTGGSFSLEDVVGDITNGSSKVLSLVKDLPKAASSALVGGFGLNQIKQEVFASVGTTITKLAPGMTSADARVVSEIMNNVSGGCYNVGITSRGGLAALLAGLGFLGNLLKLPYAFSSMANCLNDDNLTMAAAQPLLRRAVASGDLGLFKDVANSSAGKMLLKVAPTGIKTMMANLKKPEDLAQQDYTRYYQGMRGAYDSVDPNWMTYQRSGGNVVNATQLQGNNFATELIKSQLNEFMHPNNYLSNLQQVFPATGALNNSTAVAGVTSDLSTLSANQVVDASTAVAVTNFDFDSIGTVDTTAALEAIGSSQTRITSFDNEPFMLVSQVYRNASVESDIGTYFPEYASTMTTSFPVLDI